MVRCRRRPTYNPAVPVRSDSAGRDDDPSAAAETRCPFERLEDRDPSVRMVDVLAAIAADLDRRHAAFDLFAWLDQTTERLQPLAEDDPAATARTLFDALAQWHGLGSREADYADYRSSIVRHVVSRGRGLPIVLCVLAAELGSRLGLGLVGVNAPGHFLLRLETDGEPLYLDAYRRGQARSRTAAAAWLAETTGYPTEMIDAALDPAKPRLVAIRMLENLKRQLIDAADWSRAHRVQRRLLGLRPGSYADRRDLAAIAAQGPNPREALRLLGTLTERTDDAVVDGSSEATERERQILSQIARQARRSLIELN